MAAQVLLDKWSARGCDPDVLAAIRTGVFSIGEPAGS
jgi:peptidase E